MAVVSLAAMERARSTLEDFVRSYFMFHGLDAFNPADVFKHLPVLQFTEAFIYQLDEENEQKLLPQDASASDSAKNEHGSSIAGGTVQGETGSVTVIHDIFAPLKEELQKRNLMSERICMELVDGEEFWRLERKLCASVLQHQPVEEAAVMRAVQLKSFDYRVLNLLLYASTGRQIVEEHFKFLAVSELLVEIADDLYDYEEDVLSNAFNILRMFVSIHGAKRAPGALAQHITLLESQYNDLKSKLDGELAKKYEERCIDAVLEGGEPQPDKHPHGRWSIPAIIENEDAYRKKVAAIEDEN
eukprot:TRINITY_DN5880_c0_g1_i1.p1 TRINITY_DN5880_c0_g1~~TRINITY_DN5880_c0_g1_i1.p1  ORF type:complete len:318 (-),score=85.74 TRINITY_DN5880_c0_g1_i1:12-914(-)